MSINDCIAKNEEQYVNIALKVANDKHYRKILKEEIENNSNILFENKAVIEEYTELFTNITD